MTLSKSQYIRGLQCPKSLWLYKHRPKLRAEPKEETEALFATGYRVGDLAKTLFPGGVEMDTFANLYRLKDLSRRDEIRRALGVLPSRYAGDGADIRAAGDRG